MLPLHEAVSLLRRVDAMQADEKRSKLRELFTSSVVENASTQVKASFARAVGKTIGQATDLLPIGALVGGIVASYETGDSDQVICDPSRPPPPIVTLRPSQGTLSGQPEAFVQQPSRYLLVTEPVARPIGRYDTVSNVWWMHWVQWHRKLGRVNFVDPTNAPRRFVSSALFVDGHVAVHDFSDSIMRDLFFPYEETKDWIWYQPRQ